MANGLFCPESLPVTPKLRHSSTDSNSENTPPDITKLSTRNVELMCTEMITDKEVQKSCNQNSLLSKHIPTQVNSCFNHPPVKADSDSVILRDDRVLQNLLRNEERYIPCTKDYFKYVQVEVKPHMRKIVADWLLEVWQDLCFDQLEVFCLAMNFMDRFLAICRISRNQLQLLGTACFFIAAKIKAVDQISSEKLVMYTDYSVTAQELKDWELLVLHTLRWELCSPTSLEYLDHILPRLSLPPSVDIQTLRLKTETIITLAAKDYYFSYKPPSLVAAASIFTALKSCNSGSETKTLQNILTTQCAAKDTVKHSNLQEAISDKILKDAKMCLQILTLSSTNDLDMDSAHMAKNFPNYLTGQVIEHTTVSPDTTVPKSSNGSSYHQLQDSYPPQEAVSPQTPTSSEEVSSSTFLENNYLHLTSTPAKQDIPQGFSASVDVFSDFNSSVLQAVLSPTDAHLTNSILCS